MHDLADEQIMCVLAAARILRCTRFNLRAQGIGVALSSRDGYSVVEKIIPGGAAARLDELEPSDKIIGVAQAEGEFVDIVDMDLRDVVRLIRGKRGTTVRLQVLRQKEATERLTVSIVRDKIKLEDQAAALRFETVEGEDGKTLKLAVLELPSFYGGRNPTGRQSSRDIRDLLSKVKEEEADGLLLDLSRNGGGLLAGPRRGPDARRQVPRPGAERSRARPCIQRPRQERLQQI